MSASPTIADYVGKTFIAFSEAPQSTRGHPSPAVLEGLRVLDSKDGPILESVVAFSTESPTPSPMISRQVHLQDIIAPVPNAAAGWRIIDEAQAQSDDTFKETLDGARSALQKVINQKHEATRLSIEIGAAAINAITQETAR